MPRKSGENLRFESSLQQERLGYSLKYKKSSESKLYVKTLRPSDSMVLVFFMKDLSFRIIYFQIKEFIFSANDCICFGNLENVAFPMIVNYSINCKYFHYYNQAVYLRKLIRSYQLTCMVIRWIFMILLNWWNRRLFKFGNQTLPKEFSYKKHIENYISS